MKNQNLADIIRTSFIVSHAACFILGSVEGALAAANLPQDLPRNYFWGVNVITSTLFKIATTTEESYTLNALKGIALGTAAAPIEYALGYALGYSTQYIVERL